MKPPLQMPLDAAHVLHHLQQNGLLGELDAEALANQAKLTPGELETYQRVSDEINQVLEIAAARWAKGKAQGKIEGEVKARHETLLRLLGRAGLALTEEERARVAGCKDVATLDRWIDGVFGAKTAGEVLV